MICGQVLRVSVRAGTPYKKLTANPEDHQDFLKLGKKGAAGNLPAPGSLPLRHCFGGHVGLADMNSLFNPSMVNSCDLQ